MRPVDAPTQPPFVLTLPIDAVAITLACALAWGTRLSDVGMGKWATLWSSSALWLLVPQLTMLVFFAVSRRLGGRPLLVVVAMAAGGAIAWFAAQLNGVDIPRAIVVAQAWLATILALGWRSGWWLSQRSAQMARDEGPDALVAPGTSPGALLAIGRHRLLLHLLVARDLKLKYRGSLVGFFWSLANPIVMTATYTLAFTFIYKVETEGFIFLLLIGILAWTFFSASASMSTGAIIDSGSLVRSIYFPRLILPVATVLFNLIQYLLALAVLLPFMFVFYRIVPAPSLVALPALLILLAVFTLGVSLIMAAATAAYRDVRHLLDISLQVLFWATPILYSRATMPFELGGLLVLSPVAPFIEVARALVYHGVWGAPMLWLVALSYAACALTIGLTVFLRHEERFAE